MSALCSVVYGVGFAKLCVYSSAALWFRNNPAHLNLKFIFVQIACSSIISTEALGYAQSQYFHAGLRPQRNGCTMAQTWVVVSEL